MDSAIRQDQIDTAVTPLLDVRLQPGKMQIRGALRYDVNQLLAARHLSLPLPHDRPIAVYADNDELADAVVEKLQKEGFHQAARLAGGMEDWVENGLPTEDLTQEQPIPEMPEAGLQQL